jgi:hypothetical protein
MTERICRNCDHVESRHSGRALECGWVSFVITEGNMETFCPCFVFVPKNNLEFLELKVKQKEEEKLHL